MQAAEGEAGFARLRQSAGGYGEAERSERGGAGRGGAECRANPPRVPIDELMCQAGDSRLV